MAIAPTTATSPATPVGTPPRRQSRGVVAGAVILLAALGSSWAALKVFVDFGGGQWLLASFGPDVASRPTMQETIFYLALFGVILLMGMIGGAVTDRRNALRLGERPLLSGTVGLAIGLAGLSVCAVYAQIAGVLVPGAPSAPVATFLLWGAALVLVQTTAEEVFFRGWLQPALVGRWGRAAGIVAAALAFAALHIAGGARAPLSLLNLFLGGVMFGLFAARTGGIAGALGIHFAWNASEQLLWGIDPNGQDGAWIGTFGSLANYDLKGSPLWGASPEGLNAGAGMTVTLLAIVVPMALLSWRRPATPMAATSATPAFSPQPG